MPKASLGIGLLGLVPSLAEAQLAPVVFDVKVSNIGTNDFSGGSTVYVSKPIETGLITAGTFSTDIFLDNGDNVLGRSRVDVTVLDGTVKVNWDFEHEVTGGFNVWSSASARVDIISYVPVGHTMLFEAETTHFGEALFRNTSPGSGPIPQGVSRSGPFTGSGNHAPVTFNGEQYAADFPYLVNQAGSYIVTNTFNSFPGVAPDTVLDNAELKFKVRNLTLNPLPPIPPRPPMPADNIVDNPSFENGLNPWTAAGGGGAANRAASLNVTGGGTPAITDQEGAADGSFVASFNAGDVFGDQTLQQVLATTPGGEYDLSFDYGSFSLAGPAVQSLLVEVLGTNGALLLSETVSDAGTYPASFEVFEGSFVADGSQTTLRFTDLSGPVTGSIDLLLDRVVVTPVPEPSAATAAAAALLTVAAGRRRRRRVCKSFP